MVVLFLKIRQWLTTLDGGDEEEDTAGGGGEESNIWRLWTRERRK